MMAEYPGDLLIFVDPAGKRDGVHRRVESPRNDLGDTYRFQIFPPGSR